MPTYEMEYGDQFLSVELTKGNILGSIEAKQVEKIPDLPAKIIEQLRNPIASPPLNEIIDTRDRVIILVRT